MKDTLVPIMTALIAAGLGGFGAAGISARAQMRKARQDEERLPAEVEGLFLGNAERALAILQGALDRAEEQIGRLETALQARDTRIERLERQLADMRRQLARMQTQTDQLGVSIAELRDDEHLNAEGD